MAVAVAGLLGPILLLLGLLIGLQPLVRTLSTTWEARHWAPVAATVVEHAVVHHRRGVGLHVVYRYEWAGRFYLAERLGPEPDGRAQGGEPVQRWSERLTRAQRDGVTVSAWVDPAAPHRALLQRRPDPVQLLLALPFALGFTSLGAALCALAWWLWRLPADATADDWSPGAGAAVRWVVALGWSSLSLPVTAVFWLQSPGVMSALLLLVFDGVALSLLWTAWSDGGRRGAPEALALLGLLACLVVGGWRQLEPVTPTAPVQPATALPPHLQTGPR